MTRAYEAASQSLERILEKSGGVEAEAQRRIAGMTSEIEEIKVFVHDNAWLVVSLTTCAFYRKPLNKSDSK